MKQKLTLLLLALFTTMGAWAQVVTDYASAGSPVTYSDYVASAGTGARYAFMMPSDNGATLHKWVGFNSTVGNDNTLTVDRLFVLENSNNTGKYWLKRYSNGEYLAGNNSFSNTPLDLTLDNRRAGDYATEYSESNLHISFDANGGHFNNGNGSYNFAGGTGGWSTCIAYGPYYIATVNCYEEGTTTPVQEPVTYIVKNGATVNAPQIYGYASNNESVTIDGADVVLNCYYTAQAVFDPNDVAGKTFTLKCARGYVYWNGTAMKGNASNATKFAIVSYDSNTYLYDATNNAFVCHTTAAKAGNTGNPALESSTDFSKAVKNISFGSTNIAAYPFYVQENQFGNWLNMDTYPNVYFNTWKTIDDGNTYEIEVADTDFDQTDAVAMLDDYFNGPTAFANAIAQLENYPYGTGLNQYSLVVENNDRTTQATTIISGLKAQGYSQENLATAQMLLAGTSINIPTTGKFYRIQGATSEKYLAAGMASNSKFNMTTATDATTIFYYDGDKKLTNLGSGMCNGVTASAWAWVTGDGASTVTFKDGLTNGGYAIQTGDAHFYDNGDATVNSADRGGNISNMSSQNVRYRKWYLTEVTSLPITISSAGYATLYSPVALTIPSGVTAYYISALTETEATLTEITTTIAANTPVILQATAGTYNFVTTTGGTDVSASNKLAGSVVALAVSADDVTNKTYYTLQQNVAGDAVGLFPKTAVGSIAGFKAYLPATNLPSAGVKGFAFIFDDDATGINDALRMKNDESSIYNLAGQRISKMQKGINIVNGKKIMVK